MSLRFPYRRFNSPQPIWTLFGKIARPRPVVQLSLIGPAGTWVGKAILDTGADETVFPDHIVSTLGLDLTQSPIGSAIGLGFVSPSIIRYAELKIRLTDGRGFHEWPARIGFTSAPLRTSILGFAGCLEFFVAAFDGNLEQVELTVNPMYPGI
jgi:hypothetical protein